MENTNLNYLHQRTDELSPDQRDVMESHLIGWLSGMVSPEQWKDAVDAAVAHAERNPARR
jgi:hypothetical protein